MLELVLVLVGAMSLIGLGWFYLWRYKEGPVTIRLAYCSVVWCGVVIVWGSSADDPRRRIGALEANGLFVEAGCVWKLLQVRLLVVEPVIR